MSPPDRLGGHFKAEKSDTKLHKFMPKKNLLWLSADVYKKPLTAIINLYI